MKAVDVVTNFDPTRTAFAQSFWLLFSLKIPASDDCLRRTCFSIVFLSGFPFETKYLLCVSSAFLTSLNKCFKFRWNQSKNYVGMANQWSMYGFHSMTVEDESQLYRFKMLEVYNSNTIWFKYVKSRKIQHSIQLIKYVWCMINMYERFKCNV